MQQGCQLCAQLMLTRCAPGSPGCVRVPVTGTPTVKPQVKSAPITSTELPVLESELCLGLLGWRHLAGSLRSHNLWNSSAKGRSSSASSVTTRFSVLLCTAVSVQLREPVMSSRPSTRANL
ncbi:hypothetical protein EYF80_006184 [Liparis tanakae]|uniref:Uncharacterized protein n=1 Tax=Liparis tanakae TaxID=230148 RepID=A0A4Z2J0G5_9TELE|nr:hypothetical protein EYF80_006184 [Liparis tanakae]